MTYLGCWRILFDDEDKFDMSDISLIISLDISVLHKEGLISNNDDSTFTIVSSETKQNKKRMKFD